MDDSYCAGSRAPLARGRVAARGQMTNGDPSIGGGGQHRAGRVCQAIPIGPAAPATARDALADLTSAPDSTMRSAQLLVSDLVTHRVRDATADCEGMLGLEAFLTSQCLHVEVTDEGRPTDLANRRQEQPILGFELQVIAELADRWGVRHNSVRHNTIDTLWFELDV